MNITKILKEIKPTWLNRVSFGLARGESVRENFKDQLCDFYEFLKQSVLSGDPAWLDNILETWITSKSQTELGYEDVSLLHMFDFMVQTTIDIAQEDLESSDGLLLVSTVMPLYLYAHNYIVNRESELRINQITKELESVRTSLEKLDKSKSDFIAVAAHELKTPLTLIEGYTSMLRESFPKSDQESHTVILLKGMDNGLRRLQSIINDMIDVSLIDNNMLKLNFQPIWIKQLLEISQRELTRYVSERSQSFEVVYFDGSEEMTYADPERITQALKNLLSNAIKYTPDGGKITVDGRKLPGFVELTIQDTGIGIDEDYHEIIFEKFGRLGDVKLHSSGKTKFKGGGPGLGLPITKGIIEAHGGTIWVESEGYDEIACPGTTFHVLLPLVKEPPDEKISKLFHPL
jgi:signal transduction histidine kinase